MSSTSTSSAFVLRGQYNEESRKHPGLAFMEIINNHFDSRDHSDYESLYTEDFAYRSTHGDILTHQPGYHDNHSFQTAAAKYYLDPLDDHEHFVDGIIALEDKDGGYDLYWMGDLFAHVKGTPEEGEEKAKDPKGQEWDVLIPVSYHFDIIKDPSAKHGYRMADMKAWKDILIVNDILDKRNQSHLRSFSISKSAFA